MSSDGSKGSDKSHVQSSQTYGFDQFLESVSAALSTWKKESGTRSNDAERTANAIAKLIGARPDHGAIRILKKLAVGELREILSSEIGVNPTKNQVIEDIAKKLGNDRWNELATIFAALPRTYEMEVRRPKELITAKAKMAKDCRALADYIDGNSLRNQTDPITSPFNGLLAKQVFTTEWFLALRALRDSISVESHALEVAKQCFFGLYYTDADKAIVRLLRGYAEALDKWKPADHVDEFLKFAAGKLNEREFVKRVVFFMLDRDLNPEKRTGGAPNKETAIIVNAVLGLRGRKAVKANDITAMNKRGRSQYYKLADECASRVKRVHLPE